MGWLWCVRGKKVGGLMMFHNLCFCINWLITVPFPALSINTV